MIIRTASEGVDEEDIRTDVNRLQERWTQIEAKADETKKKAAGAAVALYEEPDVLVKVIRDLFNDTSPVSSCPATRPGTPSTSIEFGCAGPSMDERSTRRQHRTDPTCSPCTASTSS